MQSFIIHDRVKCTSNGFIWPFDKIVNTLIRKNIEQFVNDNQSVLEDMFKSSASEFCSPYYSKLKKDKEFKKIVKQFLF